MHDITLARENRDNLQIYSDRKNSILQIISHDLAGPMSTIGLLSDQLAKHGALVNDEAAKQMLEKIKRTSTHGVSLIQEFLNQEFLSSTQVDLQKRRVDLTGKIGEIIDQYRGSEQQIGKRFEYQTPGSPVFAAVDEPKFMQVVTNLLSNAVKFTHEDGQITVRIEDRPETGTVLISVADNGIGIPEALQAGIFDKFTKSRRPGVRGEPSIGLGMSLVKLIVGWHNGRVWFESGENQGSTFFVEISR